MDIKDQKFIDFTNKIIKNNVEKIFNPILIISDNIEVYKNSINNLLDNIESEPLVDLTDYQLTVMKNQTEKYSTKDLQSILNSKAINFRMIFLSLNNSSLEVQNSLLKYFEEPAENTLIIIISSDYFNILPTIMSRTNKYYASKLDYQALRSYILTHDNYKQLTNLELNCQEYFIDYNYSNNNADLLIYLSKNKLEYINYYLDNFNIYNYLINYIEKKNNLTELIKEIESKDIKYIIEALALSYNYYKEALVELNNLQLGLKPELALTNIL